MLKVGSKFYTFDDLSRRLEEFQQIEQVQLWVRDSRTVVAAAKRARRKSLNPALKYAELTYSCVFGGRRPSDQTKTHNQTSAGGCPFKVRLSTSIDGQALVVKEICHDHNHEPGKKLHEEPRRLYKNKANNRAGVRKPVRYLVNKKSSNANNDNNTQPSSLPSTKTRHHDTTSTSTSTTTTIRLTESPFHNLQLHNQQQQQLKLQLEQQLEQLRTRQKQVEDTLLLDSPDHVDTPDHLTTELLSTQEFFPNFQNLVALNNTTAAPYSYLPPSPISPSSLSSGGQTGYSSDEDELIDPIVDLDVALEEALGDLDSVGSMDLEDKLELLPVGGGGGGGGSCGGGGRPPPSSATSSVIRSSSSPCSSSDSEPSLSAPMSASPAATSSVIEDPGCAPPPPKRLKGLRLRKTSISPAGGHAGGGGGTIDIPELSDYMDFDIMLF